MGVRPEIQVRLCDRKNFLTEKMRAMPKPKDSAYPDAQLAPIRAPKSDEQVPKYAITIKDFSDPNSLASKTKNCGKLHDSLMAIPDNILLMAETDYYKKFKPDEILSRLKYSFWDEYARALDGDRFMSVQNIVRGVCYSDYFTDRICNDLEKLGWIILPPKDYVLGMRSLLELGTSRLRDILDTDFVIKTKKWNKDTKRYDRTTTVNAAVMKEIRATVEYIDQRVKGAIVQRLAIEQKSTNLNLNQNVTPAETGLPTSMDELLKLEERLKNIEKLAAKHAPKMIEAEIDEREETAETIAVSATGVDSPGT